MTRELLKLKGNRELTERRERLARTDARVAKLVDFIASGGDSPNVRQALKDLEAQQRAERDAISALEAQAGAPVRLPMPEDVIRWWDSLEQLFRTDPVLAREGLRRLFRGGQLLVAPQPEGYYMASGDFLPLVALTEAQGLASLSTRKPRWTSIGCAGSQLEFPAQQLKELRTSGCRSGPDRVSEPCWRHLRLCSSSTTS